MKIVEKWDEKREREAIWVAKEWNFSNVICLLKKFFISRKNEDRGAFKHSIKWKREKRKSEKKKKKR